MGVRRSGGTGIACRGLGVLRWCASGPVRREMWVGRDGGTGIVRQVVALPAGRFGWVVFENLAEGLVRLVVEELAPVG